MLAEIPRVREDFGYPPLVTPSSQIVGTQAVLNIITGERYKMVTKEFKGLVHGDYGKTPAPIKPEFTKKILGDEQPITCRFADTLAPEMDKLKAEAAKWATQEEDVLTMPCSRRSHPSSSRSAMPRSRAWTATMWTTPISPTPSDLLI